eukprot:3311534-Alexandrium_andersonii.AAC.1
MGGPRPPARRRPVLRRRRRRDLAQSGACQAQLRCDLGPSPGLAPGNALQCCARGCPAARSLPTSRRS